MKIKQLHDYLSGYSPSPAYGYVPLFSQTGERKSVVTEFKGASKEGVPVFTNEFWTSGQRRACSLHEVSYRACFKPQLPGFFIRLLTEEGDLVYDPFAGRGTTAVEAALAGRRVVSNDVNPLSRVFTRPRFFVPALKDVQSRLAGLKIDTSAEADIDLSMFYHPDTEAELVSLRNYLLHRRCARELDALDQWIAMVATNRLTGHSSGFFSVYTLPPNQAASQDSQRKINKKRRQNPQYRGTKERILKKSKSLMRDVTPELKLKLCRAGESALLLAENAGRTAAIKSDSVKLTVTSPPFLDVVSYARDNWLRCWFNGYDTEKIAGEITIARTVEEWSEAMSVVFAELYRITAPGGWVAFEVGEVRGGKVQLDRYVPSLGEQANFECAAVMVNEQKFTKTSNIWGVKNNKAGTNTNRIVLFYKN